MASADEDNFDIDIYGDGEGDMGNDGNMDFKQDEEEPDFIVDQEEMAPAEEPDLKTETEKQQPSTESDSHVKVTSEDNLSKKPIVVPSKPVVQQGIKRKETSDERPVDHGATSALMISDLHWWITEDDIRGWANEAGAEDELKELTFSEHKVNGKSKGFVFRDISNAALRWN